MTALDLEGESLELVETASPDVCLDPDRLHALSIRQTEALVVEDCAERLAMLARQRWVRPLSLRASREARITSQLDAIATVRDGIELARAWATANDRDPWARWALTMIAARAGLPEDAWRIADGDAAWVDVRVFAEALALVDARPPSDAKTPGEVALQLEVGSLHHQGGVVDEAVARHLASPHAVVRAAAWRALSRLPRLALQDLGAELESALSPRWPDVFFEAARCLALWGRDDGLVVLRRSPELADALATDALELFVMGGASADLDVLGGWLRRRRIDGADLDALARFGHPEAWAFLAHFLSDAALGEAAESALRTLFGDVVDEDRARDRDAWEHGIATIAPSPHARIRGGRTWTPAGAIHGCADGSLSARAIGLRLDEVRGRSRGADDVAMAIDRALWRYEPSVSERVADWAGRVRDVPLEEDTWRTR